MALQAKLIFEKNHEFLQPPNFRLDSLLIQAMKRSVQYVYLQTNVLSVSIPALKLWANFDFAATVTFL